MVQRKAIKKLYVIENKKLRYIKHTYTHTQMPSRVSCMQATMQPKRAQNKNREKKTKEFVQ